jgi:hypothetical protein
MADDGSESQDDRERLKDKPTIGFRDVKMLLII